MTNETTKKTRSRPPKDRGDREVDSLLQMEQNAQNRIKTSGRKSSLRGQKLRMPIEPDPNYEYYWASDNPQSTGYFQDMLNVGYIFAKHQVGEMRGEPIANRTKSTTMYLMMISRKEHEELKAIHREEVNRTEIGLRELKENEYGSANGSDSTIKQEIENTSAFNPLMD